MARREPRSAGPRPGRGSGSYLLFCTLAVVVALVGVGILLADYQSRLGRTLLVGGDAAAVAGFVLYVRRRG